MASGRARCQTRPVATSWNDTPRASVRRYGARVGEDVLVERLIALLDGAELTDELAFALAGPASRPVLAGGAGGPSGYWARVWALRGLLYVFDDVATSHVVAACADPAWRVREMALKVVATHALDDALEAVAARQLDDVARVRAASTRALQRLVS